MEKALIISLIVTLLTSFTGFTISFTLHCLNMKSDMEMCHHKGEPDEDCEGSCMVRNVSDAHQNNSGNSRSNSALLAQYRMNLLATDTRLHDLLSSPLYRL